MRRMPSFSPALLAAILAALCVLLVEGAQGFPGLDNARGDNDSLLRLVEVRDLLAGQGWFDLTQYRLGLEGGTPMHWSRLVDAPIAAIIWAVSSVTGSMQTGENVAVILWPVLNLGAALYFIVRAAQRYGGDNAVLPAAIIGAMCLYSVGIFAPAAIDHHNVQFALTMATLSLLLDARERPGLAFGAGVGAGLSIAIGMETAPYVAGAGCAVALLYLVKGRQVAAAAANFGLGFALTGLAVLVATVPPSRWFAPACDAFSIVQFAVAIVGGLGLAAATRLSPSTDTVLRRALALGMVAAAVGLVLAAFFPQCLAAPYADLDPRQKIYWLKDIREAQPLWSVIDRNPTIAFGFFATPLLALGLIGFDIRRNGLRREHILIGICLLAATIAGVFQIRSALFALGFALIPLAAWIARWRASVGSSLLKNGRLILAWLLSINLTWAVAAGAVEQMVSENKTATEAEAETPDVCSARKDFAVLDALAPTTVLAGVTLGAPILRFTPHRAVAGPYHRNQGNLFAYEAFIGDIAKVPALLAGQGISVVAVCRAADEAVDLTAQAPDSLHARLMRGDPPAWLEIVPQSKGQPVEIYRLRGANG